MFALVIENDPTRLAPLADVLAGRGYRVIIAGSVEDAQVLARVISFDVVIQVEVLGSRLTHAALLSAARRNPDLSAILLARKSAEAAGELFDVLPNLYAILPQEADVDLIVTFIDAARSADAVPAGAARPSSPLEPDTVDSIEGSLAALEKLFSVESRDATIPEPVH